MEHELARRPVGPTVDQMRAHLAEALVGHRLPDMRDRTLHLHRGTSPRAWAARAIASRREGTFAPAVAEGTARHRTVTDSPMVRRSGMSPADFAVLAHMRPDHRGTQCAGGRHRGVDRTAE
ncbi:hypothetical protein OG758_00435 [Streptomyces sp. NBC_01474]|uniref:hypothetical protein n=1 Tax=Streptomyces sp. NBC_01474 TaxID=2903880 RepID=UPI002DD92625|nr:hypothetical protein [Streptomyces sp. NBC_01474]WSD92831.1 hypothetical protein OG758_00435 [Streptomyces sp. NBC_01474]